MKKIRFLIFIVTLAIIPFKVNATTYTNIYLFTETISPADSSEYRRGLVEDCDNDLSSECTLVWENRTETVYFKNNIPSNAVIESSEFVEILPVNGGRYTYTLFDNFFSKLVSNQSVYASSDATYKYFLQSTNTGTFEYPNFFEEYDVSDQSLLDKLIDVADYAFIPRYINTMGGTKFSSTTTVEENITSEIKNNSPVLTFNLNRSFSLATSAMKSSQGCLNLVEEGIISGDPERITSYTCIWPSVYVVNYTLSNEGAGTNDNAGNEDNVGDSDNSESNNNSTITKYTITYHKNDGSTDVKNADNSTTIGENPFTRSGYKFVGWSTNKDATKADSNYEPGDTYDKKANLDLYAVWVKVEGATGTTDQSKNGLGYSVGIIGAILVATGAGVVYFKRRNKFENI